VSNTRLCISFQHDGTTPHFSREVRRQWLSQNYPGHWTRRGRETPIPGLHTHLTWTLSTFVLWECLEIEICTTTVDNRDKLRRLINLASEIKKTPESSSA
jgi:hypothetical protein